MNKLPKQLFSYTGGKTRYIKHIIPHLRTGKVYVEPFVGAGSVLCAVHRSGMFERYVINDRNPDLISLYRAIQVRPQDVIDEATELQRERSRIWLTQRSGDALREHFCKVRDVYSRQATPGALLFLAKTCFNGVWHRYIREDGIIDMNYGGDRCLIPSRSGDSDKNTAGRQKSAFNGGPLTVPEPRLLPVRSGDQVGIENQSSKQMEEASILAYNAIGQPDNIMAWHEMLQRTEIFCGDYSDVPIPKGATIYCDPPYLGTSVAYLSDNSRDFTVGLLDTCRSWSTGSQVLMTNKEHPKHPDVFTMSGSWSATISGFEAKHNTRWNSKAAERAVKEFIISWAS